MELTAVANLGCYQVVLSFSGKQIMHDPMAMRPFFGYNFGEYLNHWLSLKKPGRKVRCGRSLCLKTVA